MLIETQLLDWYPEGEASLTQIGMGEQIWLLIAKLPGHFPGNLSN
jgi:hypothetical protein